MDFALLLAPCILHCTCFPLTSYTSHLQVPTGEPDCYRVVKPAAKAGPAKAKAPVADSEAAAAAHDEADMAQVGWAGWQLTGPICIVNGSVRQPVRRACMGPPHTEDPILSLL